MFSEGYEGYKGYSDDLKQKNDVTPQNDNGVTKVTNMQKNEPNVTNEIVCNPCNTDRLQAGLHKKTNINNSVTTVTPVTLPIQDASKNFKNTTFGFDESAIGDV